MIIVHRLKTHFLDPPTGTIKKSSDEYALTIDKEI